MNSDDFVNQLISSPKFLPVSPDDFTDNLLYDYLVDQIKNISKTGTKIITLVGGVASGKTTLASELVKRLGSADSITTDAFAAGTREYRHTQYGQIDKKNDLVLYAKKLYDLVNLKEGETIRFPQYDEKTGLAAAAGEANFPKIVKKVEYFIVEGDFNFSKGDEDLAIYFHVPDEIRTANRINRDVIQRGWADTDKLKNDIKVRDEKQHFPFTLPNAADSDILIVAKVKDGKYTYQLYTKNTTVSPPSTSPVT